MLAEMIAFLGQPSSEFLERVDETLAYWNHEGKCSLGVSHGVSPSLYLTCQIRCLERVR